MLKQRFSYFNEGRFATLSTAFTLPQRTGFFCPAFKIGFAVYF
jgi:hypothetical protein